MPRMIVCAACGCHAKAIETTCPHCGETMRRSEGRLALTTAALILGLTSTTVSLGACEDDRRSSADDDDSSTSTNMQAYGVPDVASVTTGGGMGGAGGNNAGGDGGSGANGGSGQGGAGGN